MDQQTTQSRSARSTPTGELSISDLTLWGLFQMGTSQLTTGNLIQVARQIEKLGANKVVLPYLSEVPHRDIDWKEVGQQFQQTRRVIVVPSILPEPASLRQYVTEMGSGEYSLRLSANGFPAGMRPWLQGLSEIDVSVTDQFECELDLQSTDLMEELEQLQNWGVRNVVLVDRSGLLLPAQVEQILKPLADSILSEMTTVVQFRNDMGVAVANSLVSLDYGVSGVDCSLIGVGPYAGVTPLEEIAVSLALHHEQYGYQTTIRTEGLLRANQLVADLAGLGLVPNKPVSGENIFATEAGIHQDGLLKNPDTYLPYRPELVGAEGIQLVIGRHSGRRAVQHRLSELGIEVDDSEVLQVLEMIKELPKGQKVDNRVLTEFAARLKQKSA